MNAAILITARLKSVRLPRKVLKPLEGKPMLHHQVERLRAAKMTDQIILCTSQEEEDRPLLEAARELGIKSYAGHPDDVLERLTAAAEEAKVDHIFNCTGDNVLISPECLDRQLTLLVDKNYDYVYCHQIPIGTFGWALKVEAMRKACEIKDQTDTEIWGKYFTETGVFNYTQMDIPEEWAWPGLRLTIDTPEDFTVVEQIYRDLYKPGQLIRLEEIISYCRAHPELLEINQSTEQRKGLEIRLKNTKVDET